MHRQLRELDRWYAEQNGTPGGPRRDLRRRFLVAGVTTLVAVLATGCLLQQEGYRLDRTGLHFRTGHGPVRHPAPSRRGPIGRCVRLGRGPTRAW